MTAIRSNTSLSQRIQDARRITAEVGQEHVLAFVDQLDEVGTDNLISQIESIDWPEVARLVDSHVKHKPAFALPDNVEPAPYYRNQPPIELRAKYQEARHHGQTLISEGKVAAFTVAGGQGTRLGWDAPKGTFPATPVKQFPLFECLAQYIRKARAKWSPSKPIPWYVMTSPINDQPTRAFFQANQYFGLDPADVMIFPQQMMPALDMTTGKALLEAPDSLALSPNGHGGSLKALYNSGAIADMQRRGIEQISYTQIDNPIVRVLDPIFLGLHDMDDAQMSSKMLPKAYPKEKLGNFCLIDGKMTVIEYSDLPDELAFQRLENGELRFRAGSIAIHALRVDFVASINEGAGGFALPFHRAEKKVPHLDLATGEAVKPTSNNAVKLETFVFDALPMCDRSIVYETDRDDEFAPIKNADNPPGGEEALDSPASSKRIQVARAAAWLQSAGVTVPRDASGKPAATIEITQLTAIYPEDLKEANLPKAIEAGAEVVL